MKVLFTICAFAIAMLTSKSKCKLDGAWIVNQNDTTEVLLFCDGYFTATRYTQTSFIETMGGTFEINGDRLIVKEEFNTSARNLNNHGTLFEFSNGKLHFVKQGLTFDRIDSNGEPLSGVWKITRRMQDGKLVPIHQTGTRKTLKILTGKRFQWFAIDPATNGFSGTGGGTYTFMNGKYVENIEFFSRDASRIGASLSFDDHLDNGEWHHTGLSSKGAKIYEVWSKVVQ